MKQAVKILFFLIIMITSTIPSDASSFKKEWKHVEELLSQDLPESAYEAVESIFAKAQRKGNDYQMLRARSYMVNIGAEYREEFVREAFDGFNELMPRLHDEYLPLGWAILGNCYREYYERNYRSISNRERLEIVSDDMELWDESVFTDTIEACLMKSITIGADIARRCSPNDYKGLIDQGNKEGDRLRPTLYDALLDNALWDNYRHRDNNADTIPTDDGRLYSMESYVELTDEILSQGKTLPHNALVLRELALNYRSEKDIDVRAFSEMNFLSDIDEYLHAYLCPDHFRRMGDAMLKLGKEYLETSSVSAEMMAEYAMSYMSMSEEHADDSLTVQEMVELCRKAEMRWPGTEGAVKCHNYIASQSAPSISFIWAHDERSSSANPVFLNLVHKNVSKVYFKAVLSESIARNVDRQLISQLNARPYSAAWELEVTDNSDFSEQHTICALPELNPDDYCIMVSDDPLFGEKSAVSVMYLNVGTMTFVTLNTTSHPDQMAGYVVDRISGSPVGDCNYTLTRVEGYGRNEKRTVLAEGVTGADGLIEFNRFPSTTANLELELEKDGEVCVRSIFNTPQTDRPIPYIAHIYTDRYTYRPGETVQFNCITYHGDGTQSGSTVADMALRFVLRDANWQVVDTLSLTTDRFGTACGSFKIPRDRLPGRYSVQVNGVDEDFISSRPINVEEFRQPTFYVEMEGVSESLLIDSAAVVNGSAVTYTGVPLSGAKVQYTVTALPSYRWLSNRAETQILSGECQTGADGTFSIGFQAGRSAAVNPYSKTLCFRVEAQITDLNGETHSQTCFVTAGEDARYAVLLSAAKFTAAPEFLVAVENESGNRLGGLVEVIVERVAVPDRLQLKPDIMDLYFVSGDRNWQISEGLSDRYPQYDFSSTGESDWRSVEEVFRTVAEVTGDAGLKVSLPSALPTGTYRVRARVSGAGEESERKAMFRSVIKDERKMPDNSLLFAISVSDSYRVGETAELIVGSANPDAFIYYSVNNRYGIVDKGVIRPEGGTKLLSVPVTKEMKGGFQVSFGTVFQDVRGDASFDIDVPFEDKKLDISLVTFRDMLEPDQTETWELKILDNEGRPADASLMLGMYDSAMDVYGVNQWDFMPWNRFYAYGSPLFGTRNITTSYVLGADIDRLPSPGDGYPEFARIISPLSGFLTGGMMAKSMMVGALPMNVTHVAMEEFAGLGMVTLDESLQGRIAGLSLVESDVVSNDQAQDEPQVRSDLNTTAFFVTNLRTDRNGAVKFSFKTPQLLTRWNFIGLAHTEDLKSAGFRKQVTTRKELMIEPRAPRFVRQGDQFEFSSKLMNVTANELNATVVLQMTDAVSGKTLQMVQGKSTRIVTVPAGQSVEVSFPITVPDGVSAFTYRITASADKHSDGQQETIPVLSTRTVVTESVSLFNNGHETRSFELKALTENLLSETATDRTLTLEYTPSPVWYAIQALPYLSEGVNPSNESLFHRYFANALSADIISRYPAVASMLETWAGIPADEWQTQLEKNEDLKQTLLKETPWVLTSKGEKENLRRLAEAYSQDRIADGLKTSLAELIRRAEPDGGWSWMPGSKPDFWVTSTIVYGISQLVEIGALDLESNPELKDAVCSGLQWMDRKMVEWYEDVKLGDVKHVSENELEWLLAHSRMKNIAPDKSVEKLYRFLLKLAGEEETYQLSLHTRATLAMLMSSEGEEKRAGEIVATLLERSLYDDEQGRWWRDNTGGFYWHQAPIETQSRIINALLVTDRKSEAAECARWLLKQRQTTHWASSPATAQAVMALLKAGWSDDNSVHTSTGLEPVPTLISIGSETLTAGGKSADSGYMIRKWTEPADQEMGRVKVSNNSSEIGWGALSIQYTEEMSKVRYSENGISLKRTLYRVDEKNDGLVLHEVAEGETLHVGDRLRIRIELGCDRNLEFVQLKDMRPASFEPVSTHSGYSYNLGDDLRCYVVPENASQVFYIDRLERGRYVVEYDVYAEQAGTFSSGIVSAQCMYAPEFRCQGENGQVSLSK